MCKESNNYEYKFDAIDINQPVSTIVYGILGCIHLAEIIIINLILYSFRHAVMFKRTMRQTCILNSQVLQCHPEFIL